MPADTWPPQSWIAPDDVPALAAQAVARIDASLSRLTETDREAFWASVRKCYNTPYNDPKPRALPRATVPPPTEPAEPASRIVSALAAPALAAVMSVLPGPFPAESHAA